MDIIIATTLLNFLISCDLLIIGFNLFLIVYKVICAAKYVNSVDYKFDKLRDVRRTWPIEMNVFWFFVGTIWLVGIILT